MPSATEIASFLHLPLCGSDLAIEGFSQLSAPQPHTVVFAKKHTPDFAAILNIHPNILAIVSPDYEGTLNCSHLLSPNPRLDYIKTLSHFFAPAPPAAGIHPTAVVEEGAAIGKNVFIGAGCYVSGQSVIGDNCLLHPRVVLYNQVILGRNCELKSGVVLGQEGFGFERDTDGTPLHFPHFGNVVVGDNVFIGSNSTVERATLGSTRIDNDVKIDDLVQIGHNSHIGAGSMITVGAVVCGGAVLGERSYLAPHVCVKEKVTVGRGGFAGLGAVVIRDIAEETVVVGNPAKPIEKR